ncbi:MAG: hypothetical protein PVJ64_00405 [Gemmatimonadales bacterium]|jgi:hypothetical protein
MTGQHPEIVRSVAGVRDELLLVLLRLDEGQVGPALQLMDRQLDELAEIHGLLISLTAEDQS